MPTPTVYKSQRGYRWKSSHEFVPFMVGVYNPNVPSTSILFPPSRPLYEFLPINQQIMDSSHSSDWDETFQYLSQEMLAPEIMATDLQQVPTPPVRFGPLRCGSANLTLVCFRYRPRLFSHPTPGRSRPSSRSRTLSFQGPSSARRTSLI